MLPAAPPNPESFALIGTSEAMARVRAMIEVVRDLDCPVFISGESGTGKELVARSIHFRGARRAGRFVALNCGAIPEHLLESELFGHARGAFTGALRDKPGLVEEAAGGTFFLDEIADLGALLQAKILRVLQEREIRRVGETRFRPVDARFLSATNRDLDREMDAGRFREDLYYRLRIVTIDIPPLRERREDLAALVDHFLDRYGTELGKAGLRFSPSAFELLHQHAWPGNVRELQNEVQRSLIMCGTSPEIRPEHLSERVNPKPRPGRPAEDSFFEAKADFVKRYIRQALARYDFNKARTAEEIGLSRQALFKLIKKHRIPGSRAALDAQGDIADP